MGWDKFVCDVTQPVGNTVVTLSWGEADGSSSSASACVCGQREENRTAPVTRYSSGPCSLQSANHRPHIQYVFHFFYLWRCYYRSIPSSLHKDTYWRVSRNNRPESWKDKTHQQQFSFNTELKVSWCVVDIFCRQELSLLLFGVEQETDVTPPTC